MRKLKIDKKHPLPVYQQIKDRITEQVKSGALKPRDRLPSIAQMAKDVSVSPMTVLQAYIGLTNEGIVVREHGRGTFIAEPSASKFSGKSVKKIAVDIGVITFDLSSNPVFTAAVLSGAGEICRDNDFNIHLISSSGDSVRNRNNAVFHNLVVNHQLDGLLIGGPLHKDDIETFREEGIPFVLFDNDYRGAEPVPTVLINDRAAITSITERLVEKGHEKIALLAGPQSSSGSMMVRRGEKLVEGFAAAMLAKGGEVSGTLVKRCESSQQDAYAAVMEILSATPRPTALIADGDILTQGAIKALDEKGISVPEDIEIANYADSATSPFAVCVKPLEKMGEAAMSALGKLMNGEKIENSVILEPLTV